MDLTDNSSNVSELCGSRFDFVDSPPCADQGPNHIDHSVIRTWLVRTPSVARACRFQVKAESKHSCARYELSHATPGLSLWRGRHAFLPTDRSQLPHTIISPNTGRLKQREKRLSVKTTMPPSTAYKRWWMHPGYLPSTDVYSTGWSR